ncbi:vWA domain-containing protein [Moraxella sp. ZY200743]|uniref:vWA domain-containing protein n=1 Tax=Moraxella sp. ZY200743 TaxID=2911970 RepID=UPI003D7D4068
MTHATQDKDTVLSRAKVKFLTKPNSIFLSTVCSNLNTKWDTSIPYGATDGKSLILNPETFLKLNDDEQVFLLAHETLHVAYQHMLRLGNRDMHLFNIAADYVINYELVEQGFTMIAGALYDNQYAGMSTEEVYDLLQNQQDTSPSNSLGQDIQYSDNPSNNNAEEINRILAQAAMVAQQCNQAGSIPLSVQRHLDELMKPKVNWKVVLRRFFSDLDTMDYTWKKPKRRYLPMYLPSRESKQLSKISIAIDTSGSISKNKFNQFITEVASIFRFLKPKEIETIQFDYGIRTIDTVKNINQLKAIDFVGGGGTCVAQVIQRFIDKPCKALIIITDGYLNINLPKPTHPVIWVIFNNSNFVAPFGQVIHINL